MGDFMTLNDNEAIGALRDLHTIQFPLAAPVIRKFGTVWNGQWKTASLLEWDSILSLMEREHLLVRGPCLDGYSFICVTPRYSSDGPWNGASFLRALLGPSWSHAVLVRIYADLQGPILFRPSLPPAPGKRRVAPGYVFRYLDRPTLTRYSSSRANRRVRGSVPPAWRGARSRDRHAWEGFKRTTLDRIEEMFPANAERVLINAYVQQARLDFAAEDLPALRLRVSAVVAIYANLHVNSPLQTEAFKLRAEVCDYERRLVHAIVEREDEAYWQRRAELDERHRAAAAAADADNRARVNEANREERRKQLDDHLRRVANMLRRIHDNDLRAAEKEEHDEAWRTRARRERDERSRR